MTILSTMTGLVAEWVAGDEIKEQQILALLDDPKYAALPYIERNRPFLTSSKLLEFKKCPYHAKLKYIDGVDMGFDDEDYFIVGQAVDDMLPYGPDFCGKKYETVARRTKEADKVQLTNTMAGIVANAVKEYQSRTFFPARPKKRNVIWIMDGVPCKAELDNWDADKQTIGDVKTCANILTFAPERYIPQFSFYSFGIEKRHGDQVQAAELYVLDKNSDFSRSHKWILSRPTLVAGYYEVQKLFAEWKQCVDSDIWPHIDRIRT